MMKHASTFVYGTIVVLLTGTVALYSARRSAGNARLLILPAGVAPASAEAGEQNGGGAGTVANESRHAFGRAPMNLAEFDARWPIFRSGKLLFDRNWGLATHDAAGGPPGPTPLGPVYDAVSCAGCHVRDGRGHPPSSADEIPETMVVRLSVMTAHGSVPHPVYGRQLGYYRTDGKPGEGTVSVSYVEVSGEFADGTPYTLTKPVYAFDHMAYGPIGERTMYSPRVAQPIAGIGLLDAIPAAAILAHADPDDRDHDGISGRPNYVTDERTGQTMLGRFGWKANQPTVEQQVENAFQFDIGIMPSHPASDGAYGGAAKDGGTAKDVTPEITDAELRSVSFYTRLAAVPARRGCNDRTVLRGKGIFHAVGCAGCHVPSYTTGAVDGLPELTHQTIFPYTDLLLHDMGAELSDNRPDGLAGGAEWRTPPLWGIGLTAVVSGHTRFLHDGRARNLEEAILWHGGEGAGARDLYKRLPRDDRAALIAFLTSL
ncbi:MAG TPA: di-heme oxidoredictase family protein [Candidatus Kapabacteria bacterium]|nr:di-heme oxidoredictase family protein [Candidatus Kapabacteria bacterium]